MKIPNWFKIIWWFLILGFATYFMLQRYNSLISGSTSLIDVFIFLIWFALLLIPLFQEVNLFGVKLKKEINALKNDIKEQMISLRSEIQNSIDFRPQFNPEIHLVPPTDSQLPAIEERIREILTETLRTLGIERPVVTTPEVEVPENSRFLFSIRYGIERELRRIYKQRFGEKESNRPVPILQMTRYLVESELIDPRLSGAIREVYVVCSPAIHGKQVSENQVRFVRDIAPELIASLKAIQ